MRKTPFIFMMTVLAVLAFGSGCSTRQSKPTVPMTVFNPTPGGTFNVRVVLFQLKGDGLPEKVEAGIVPIEQNIIKSLAGLGYHYTPNGDVNYLIEARVGSISPKLAAQGASQHIGIGIDSFAGWPAFNEYPVIVNEWTPEIQRIKSGPNTCFLTMQVLVKEVKQDRDSVIYHGTPRPIEVPYELGCPFGSCGQGTAQALTDYLLQLFARTSNN